VALEVSKMTFDEQDIVFEKLSGLEFEELCFDLLLRLGFHSLIWRQGGGDSGRDIEAMFTSTNPLIGPHLERWFFECKNHVGGINVDDLNSKVAWAAAAKPDYLVVMTSSYLTNPARHWYDEIAKTSPVGLHTVEGKQLKQLILGFPQLIAHYFSDANQKLLSEAFRAWVLHGLYPDVAMLIRIHEFLSPERLELHESAFLIASYFYRDEAIEDWTEEHGEFDFSNLISQLMARTDRTESFLDEIQKVTGRFCMVTGFGEGNFVFWEIDFLYENIQRSGVYCFFCGPNQTGLEFVIARQTGALLWLRRIEQNARAEVSQAFRFFESRLPRSSST
jgi:Restriction endonuclease